MTPRKRPVKTPPPPPRKRRRVREPLPQKKEPVSSKVVAPTPADLRRKDRLAHYQKHHHAVGEAILRAVMRCMATSQAASDVNDILSRKFGLTDVYVEGPRLNALANIIMEIEIAGILLQHSSIESSAKAQAMARTIARYLPRRDGVPQLAQPRHATRDERVADIESVVARELKRSYPTRQERDKL